MCGESWSWGLMAGYTTQRCTVLLYLTSGLGSFTGQGQGLFGCDAVKFGTQVQTFQLTPICSLFSRKTSVTNIAGWYSTLNWYPLYFHHSLDSPSPDFSRFRFIPTGAVKNFLLFLKGEGTINFFAVQVVVYIILLLCCYTVVEN